MAVVYLFNEFYSPFLTTDFNRYRPFLVYQQVMTVMFVNDMVLNQPSEVKPSFES